jgi:histidyl-tRNA synthetase
VIGESELQSGTGKIKRMSDGFEESITLSSLVNALKNAL